MQQKRKHTGGMGLYLIGGGIYIGLLILFGFQTWQFVDWLFPNDQLLMKILTVLCFDVMALFWACADLFYRFASRGARSLVRWAWAISFLLSLLASIFYLVIESMFRFQVTITQTTVNIGYGVTIFALTLNILFLTFWLYLEWAARHPYQDEYEDAAPPAQYARNAEIDAAIANDELLDTRGMKLPPLSRPAQQEHTFTEAQLRAAMSKAYDEGASHANTRPLVPAPNQQNGNKDGAKSKE